MHFFEFGAAVREARASQGVTQAQLAAMAGLSRVTVNQLENGAAPDIGIRKMARLMDLVGLTLKATRKSPQPARDDLDMACTTANVSFRTAMSPDDLAAVLLTGKVAAKYRPHLRVVLDELPRPILEGAVRQVAKAKGVTEIRANLAKVAEQVGSSRKIV